MEKRLSGRIIDMIFKHIEKTLIKKYGARSVVTYYGSTPQRDRQENIRRFQEDDETQFFIGQPMTGGTRDNINSS